MLAKRHTGTAKLNFKYTYVYFTVLLQLWKGV